MNNEDIYNDPYPAWYFNHVVLRQLEAQIAKLIVSVADSNNERVRIVNRRYADVFRSKSEGEGWMEELLQVVEVLSGYSLDTSSKEGELSGHGYDSSDVFKASNSECRYMAL
jgi:acetolactate synthase small subunit